METQSTHTSRAVSVFIIFIAFIGITALTPAKWLGVNPKKEVHTRIDISNLSSPKEVATDANGDGVISWKEIISENTKVSTSTLEEIKSIPVDPKTIAELNDPNNLTASFSKNLYVATAYFKKNNITDPKITGDAVTQLMADEAKKIKPTIYAYKELNVAKTESKESIKQYGNTIAPLLKELFTKKIIGGEMSTIYSFAKTKQESDLLPLVKNTKRVDIILQKLLKVSVPPSAVSYHILAVNRITAYRDILDNLSKASSDPVRATSVLDKYINAVILTLHIFGKFTEYFNANNTAFSPSEGGYIFTAGYTVPQQ
jgi:hypothetical protein